MASATTIASFIIFRRGKIGEPDRILSYEEEEAIHILVAIKVSRKLLVTKESRKALTGIAENLEEKHPGCWYRKWKIHEVVERFITLILDTFPVVVSDHSLQQNRGLVGAHHRRKYDQFFTRFQSITVNGSVSSH